VLKPKLDTRLGWQAGAPPSWLAIGSKAAYCELREH